MCRSENTSAIMSSRCASFFAAFIIVISLLVFTGWINGWLFLTRLADDEVPMAPSTAIIFIILSAGLWFHVSQRSRYVMPAAAITIIGLSVLFLLLRLSGYYPEWEHLYLGTQDQQLRFKLAHMSRFTAGLFIISGCAMLFLQSTRQLFKHLSFIFTLLIAGFSILLLLAYGFNAPFFYKGDMIPPASLTAFSFLLAAAGFVSASDRNIFLIKKIMSESTSAKLLRIFLPCTIALTVIESLIIVRILPQIDIHPAIGVTLVTLIFVIALCVVVPIISRALGQSLDDATENLRISEEKFSKAFQNAPLMLSLISIEDGTLLEVNEQFLTSTGYTGMKVAGRKISELGVLMPADWIRLLEELKQKKKIYNFDLVLHSRDKKIHHCLFNGELIKINDQDLLLSLVLDITGRKLAEDALRSSKQIIEGIINAIPVRVFWKDRDLVYLGCNKIFAHDAGFADPKDIIGKDDYQMQWRDQAELYRGADRQVIESGQPKLLIEEPQTTPDGRSISLLTSKIPLVDYDGKISGVLGTYIDITDRKLAEEKILQANRVYAVISQINQTIVRVKDRNELLNEVCRIAVEFGKLRMAWAGLVDEETNVVVPAAFAGVEDGYLSAIHNISISDIPEGRGPSGTAIREGRYCFCEDIATDPKMTPWRDEALKRGYRSSIALPLKLSGKCIGALTLYSTLPGFFDQEEIELLDEVANDLSFALQAIETGKRHKQAEDALREVTERLRFALDGTNDGIWDVQMETGEMYLSQRGKEILGYGPDEVIPVKTWSGIVHPDDLPQTQNDLNAYFEGRTPLFYTEQRLRTKDGGWKWILTRGKIVARDSAGKPLRMTGTHTDITERKRGEDELISAKEKAEENDRLKSAFLRNMSHELRTPMNAIMGFSGLMQEAEAAEKNYYAGIIQKSSEQLLMVLDDVMLLSRLQSEKLPVNNSSFRPAELITDIYQMFDLPDLKKGLELTVNIPEQYKNLVVMSDADKIKQVLANLVSNAIKYTLRGGVELGFDIQPGKVEFYVKDTGMGISEREQKRIFEPFYRGEQAISSAIGGTGLGLNIARELIELLGGKVGVTSAPDHGSRFYFTIPVEQSDKPHPEKASPLVVREDWKDFTILIAEDEPDNYLYLEILLKNKVQRIDHAENGLKAVELASKNRYDLVLMDLKMPVMDGIEATIKLKQQFPDMPIIAQTAYATPEEKKQALKAGFDDYICKPIKKADLLEIIGKVLAEIH